MLAAKQQFKYSNYVLFYYYYYLSDTIALSKSRDFYAIFYAVFYTQQSYSFGFVYSTRVFEIVVFISTSTAKATKRKDSNFEVKNN